MAEYIDRETLMKFPIRRDHCDKEHANEHFINGIETVMEYAENLPAADVAPVVHGRWVADGGILICLNCEAEIEAKNTFGEDNHRNYCPKCGAKMDGGAEDD